MKNKLWLGFVAVFVLVFLLDFVINMFLMSAEYEETKQLWRSPAEMKTGVAVVVYLFFAFFFTFIFSKAYEGKGIWEGVRYGLYVSLMMNVSAAYMTYATMPVPYSLALKWFLYGTVEYMILGAAVAVIYGKEIAVAAAEPREMETVA